MRRLFKEERSNRNRCVAEKVAKALGAGVLCLMFVVVAPSHILAGEGEPALPQDATTMVEMMQRLSDGSLTLTDLRRKGLEMFTTPFNTHDGYGDGPFAGELPVLEPGHRPTLQGNGMSLVVNGLDAQSCNECHSVVKMSARPPVLGIAGAGGIVQNAFVAPSLIDVADSSDGRLNYTSGHFPDLSLLHDGLADFNGRFTNPPFLYGGGGVELLAKEMTVNLQGGLVYARAAQAGTITPLITHGVDFGHIRTLAGGDVELNLKGIGFEDNSSRRPEEVLVVRPFGRKGEFFSMREFDRAAMRFHFGMQPVEDVGEDQDEDGDGVVNEVTEFEMSALHVFSVTNPTPFVERLGLDGQEGFSLFHGAGCAQCHVPVLKTRSRYLPLSYPEVPEDPWRNVYMVVDLVEVGFQPVPGEGGVFVPLFADLKRHDMGGGLAESFTHAEISNSEFTTARLWGVADTEPYLHDGRASTLYQAINAHGGDAQAARDAFAALSGVERERLVEFLRRLRTPNNPNAELIIERDLNSSRSARQTPGSLITGSR